MQTHTPFHRALVALLLLVMLAACAPTDLVSNPTAVPPTVIAPEASSVPVVADASPEPEVTPTMETPSGARRFEDKERGIALFYPRRWSTQAGETSDTLTWLLGPGRRVVAVLFYGSKPSSRSLEDVAKEIRDASASGLTDVEYLSDEAITLDDGRVGWQSEYRAMRNDGSLVQVQLTSIARGGQMFTLMAFGEPSDFDDQRDSLRMISHSMQLAPQMLYDIPRDQALVWLGGESQNPRAYDPATSGGFDLVFSGLVAFTPDLELMPDLAESWDVSDDGAVYTFHLRRNARFHNGKSVTAQDVVYSWERAAHPDTDSDIVLTYLGDIVGMAELHAGEADHASGLEVVDDHTLRVTIDAPKPYFLMKLTYGVTAVLDRENVESGAEWYRTPNGTGPYKLIRWDSFKVQIYERNDDFYLEPPAIRYIIVRLYEGVGLRLYETDEIDTTGVSYYDLARLRDPKEPLSRELIEGADMCTSYISFDVTQAPFDDPKVRQAFALAVDRQHYIDVVRRGVGIPAHGLFPPPLPGFNSNLKGLDFNPELARQRLAESRYGSAEALPPIVFTSSGFGNDLGDSVSALADMWREHLGVTIQVENLEPNKWSDELHAGNHGQLFTYGWCADYPDPENFADALFHSQAQQNLGRYSNPQVDALVEQARTEGDVQKRLALYQEAEQLLVEDAAAIFLSHSLSYVLVKPYVQGYRLTPINVPIERYLSFDQAKRQ